MGEFAKGIRVSRFDCERGGFKIKLSIQKDRFAENLFNNEGWANFDILFSKKDGQPYCILNEFHKTTALTTHKAEFNQSDEF